MSAGAAAARSASAGGIGAAVPRVDGRAKVTGEALYAADHQPADLVHAVVVNSAIARGRIVRFELAEALAVPGVLEVLTHERRPKVRSLSVFYKDMIAPAGQPLRPLHDAEVRHSGQPVALVLASSHAAARYAARLVRVHYEAAPHETSLVEHIARARPPKGKRFGVAGPPPERGDAAAAYARAALQVDATFLHAVEHHNPMELFATTVIRDPDGHLTVHDKTQGPQNNRWMLSRVFGLAKRQLTVKNEYVGGAFGAGLRPQYSAVLAVMAALALGRSVQLVLTRQQMFTFGHRPETWQRVRIGAAADGTLQSLRQEAIAETSRHEEFTEAVAGWAAKLYVCPNLKTGYRLLPLDHPTPADMRAPGAAHGLHALEVALDELAWKAGVDPLALRLAHHAERDPESGKPFSSKALGACYAAGAERFGWAARAPRVRARKDGDEWVGWGMATGIWDALQFFGRARAVLHRDGRLVVESAASDIGTGTRTVMAQIAAERTGLPLERVTFRLGDSSLPLAPVEGGSSHVASIGSAVDGACEKLLQQLWKLARTTRGAGFAGRPYEAVAFEPDAIVLRDAPATRLSYAQLIDGSGRDHVEATFLLLPDMLKQRRYTMATHGAVFVEVRVDEALGMARVSRAVSAVACGRIVNPLTAASQIKGGVVWGISQALHEETLCDHAFGRFMNHSYANYHVPVNLDVPPIDVLFAAEDDRIVSRIGAKGAGEIGIVGVSAAISNAIFHATGRRLRDTPVTVEALLGDG